MNEQPIEKRATHAYGTYSVHSIFYTIQGEGPFTGTPAVFIRLAGCNLQCPLCDTDYTSNRQERTVQELVSKVYSLLPGAYTGGLVVITGGEPFRQELTPLVLELIRLGYYVQIETNGTLEVPILLIAEAVNSFDYHRRGLYIVVSPKTGKIHPSVAQAAYAFKYVAKADDISDIDGLPSHALEHPAHPALARPPQYVHRSLIYLQPADEKNATANALNQATCIKYAMLFGYNLQLQVHKILGLE